MPNTAVTAASRLSVAPMMDWTDRHCRYLHRLMSGRTLLYTEMVTSPALVRGGAVHLLDHSPQEHPVALQLGGSDPAELAEAARMGAAAGYDEINLNCGCPSDRVQSGKFGAILMTEPALVARCVAEMRRAVDVDVTVKCRIGVDDQDPEQVLPEFLARVAAAGVERFTIHARKAWLQGLSPKENRDVPPLDYDLVQRMKGLFPALHLSVNGGISTLAEAKAFLDAGMDGVMLGRAAYQNPYVLSGVDARFYGDDRPVPSRHEVLDAFLPYVQRELAHGTHLHAMTRHILGLFQGRPGARAFRRHISENAPRSGANERVIREAMALVVEETGGEGPGSLACADRA